MDLIRGLFKQTAIYGLSSIVGRLLNFLLVPLYVSLFSTYEYGKVTDLYAIAVFMAIVLTYGMETAYFRHVEKAENRKTVLDTSFLSILFTSCIFLLLVVFNLDSIAPALRYEDHQEYLLMFAGILVLDALSAIPFASLRAENKALLFATYRFIQLGVNIGLNLFFLLLCPWMLESGIATEVIGSIYDESIGIGYIFISNLIASGLAFLLVLPRLFSGSIHFDGGLLRKELVYALPLMIAGLAGAINEVADRQIIKYLLPEDVSFHMLGVYGACYKLSIFMTLFVQAFRYGAEPFFFAQADKKNAPEIYAEVMNFFVIAMCVIFVGLNLYLYPLADIFLPNKDYHEGLFVVPILLMANLFLGVYIHLSIWYKLSDKTSRGAIISFIGALITLAGNLALVPIIGYEGSAWTTLMAYFGMSLISYIWGQKHFHVPYRTARLSLYLVLAVLFSLAGLYVTSGSVLFNTFLFLIFAAFMAYLEKDRFRLFFKRHPNS
jgi:O-antigen/teichoic acid export membrane protein